MAAEAAPSDNLTPMMQQWFEAKRSHPDAVVFFRMGDFFEMFNEDALTAAKALEITLTSRGKGPEGEAAPMCGVPAVSVDGYLARMIKLGFKVAVCDQVEDPRHAKGIVKREVVRVVTPGTYSELSPEAARDFTFLAALTEVKGMVGLALAELSTGRLELSELPAAATRELEDEFARVRPRELLVAEGSAWALRFAGRSELALSQRPASAFDPASARLRIERKLKAPLASFGLDDRPAAVAAAAALLAYLEETQKASLDHLSDIAYVNKEDILLLDATTTRNLELVRSLADGSTRATLIGTLDRTATPMGARCLRDWLTRPSRRPELVTARLDAVQALLAATRVRAELRDTLDGVRDVERLLSRVTLTLANARDLLALGASLARVPRVRELSEAAGAALLLQAVKEMDPLEDVTALVARAIAADAPVGLKDGGLIREGYHAERDELALIAREGKGSLAALEARERERTGIASLKVRYNRVFGYFIEVSKSNLALVPPDYERRQTLANAERFVTPELREWEAKVLTAEDKLLGLEYDLFVAVRELVAHEAERIGRTARALARVDVLAALAEIAAEKSWVRPRVDDSRTLKILEGRHPVVEQATGRERFVPNDTFLDAETQSIALVTGPNMGGKSTYLRQVALIAILAHMGSFVPAVEAEIGILDRVFARVGASDDLARGASTFMVEMVETANILHGLTDRSLVLLDEVGRGTSTFDGVSLAWAIVEHLHEHPRGQAKVLFATHYHELTDLADSLPRVKNLRVAVKEWGDEIVFLRRIEEGRSDRSYGIHVARLAGIPDAVVKRAREVLANLEKVELDFVGSSRLGRKLEVSAQLSLFSEATHPVLDELRALDVDALTPLQALNFLAELKRRVEGH